MRPLALILAAVRRYKADPAHEFALQVFTVLHRVVLSVAVLQTIVRFLTKDWDRGVFAYQDYRLALIWLLWFFLKCCVDAGHQHWHGAPFPFFFRNLREKAARALRKSTA